MNFLGPKDSVDVHDPDMTAVRVARLLAEFTRALNYATLPHDPRLEYPSDVSMILMELHVALSRLPQVCSQLATYLRHHRDGGVLHAERGFPHAGNPAAAVAAASAELHLAALAAHTTSRMLGRAEAAISGLSRIERTGRRGAHPHPNAPELASRDVGGVPSCTGRQIQKGHQVG